MQGDARGAAATPARAHAGEQTLANLETIKKRNRPAEAPQAPAEAPFFLPTLPGLEPVFVADKEAGKLSEPLSKQAKTSKATASSEAMPGWGDDGDEDVGGDDDGGQAGGGIGGGEAEEDTSRLIKLSDLRPATKVAARRTPLAFAPRTPSAVAARTALLRVPQGTAARA